MRILMVCLGNICRSPLAEGLMRLKMQSRGYSEVIVDSAGTGGWHVGQAPDKRSIAVAKKYGIDISSQCARKFEQEDFEKFDYIFAMDKSNLNDILALANNEKQKSKAHLFLTFAGITPLQEVPDPWYGDDSDFESVYHLLEKACEQAALRISKSTK